MTDVTAHHRRGDIGPGVGQGLLDVPALFRIVLRRRSIILTALVIAIALALAYLILVPPKYTASVVILSDPRQQNVLTSEAVLGGIGPDAAAVESQVELIQSTELVGRVIDELGLMTDPELARRSTLEQLVGLVQTVELDDTRTRGRVIDAFLKRLSVHRRGLTYIIEVSYYSADRHHAADVANAVADAYLRDQLATKFEATSDASEWLLTRMGELRDAVRASDKAVADFKAANNILDIGTLGSGETLNLRETETVNQQLTTARARTSELQAKVDQLREASRPDGDLAYLSEALDSKVLQDLRVQLAAIARREAQLSAQFKARHPSLAAVRTQLASIKGAIRDELRRLAANAGVEYAVAANFQASLEKRLDELQTAAQRMNGIKVRLKELERDQDANRRLYEQVVTRGKETKEQKSLQKADARIVAHAMPPTKPSGLGAPLTLLIAGVAGFGAGLMASLFAEALDETYRVSEGLAKDMRRRCLGLLPRTSGSLLPTAKAKPPKAFAAEVALVLQRAFAHTAPAAGRTLLVTSALPGEGKTVLAANLARQSADRGASTLLIADADVIGTIANDGVLTNDAPWQTGTAPVRGPGLHVLDKTALQRPLNSPRGAGNADPLSRLALQFDLIVIDGEAILAGQDGIADATGAAAVMLVVEWGRTPRRAVTAAIDELEAADCNLIGGVLNKVDRKRLKLFDANFAAA